MMNINKKERNIHRWLCFMLAFCILLGQFPVGVTAIESQEFSITGIQVGVYRPGNSDWYIILDTDIADFELTSISGMQAPVDDTTAQVWFQINSQLSVSKGSFALTLAADKGEHTFTIPAGTELGGYALKEDFVLRTHADGTLEVVPQGLRITGIQQGLYRPNNNDWYIILDTNIADFELTAISGMQAPVDNTTAQVWFQINSQLSVAAGSFSLTLAVGQAEHTVTIPAGTQLGEYTLKDDFVFCTHADGSLSVESIEQETTQPATTEPEEHTFNITDIRQWRYRPNNNDWYIILDTNIADFELTAISGLQAPVDNTTAQVWFQVNRQLSVPAGSFSLTLAVDQAEHTVTIPAGTVLGEYTLEEDFVFYTHADGTVTVADGEEPTDPTTEPTTEPVTEPEEKTLSITDIALGVYRANNGDWYLILNTDEPTFALTSVVGLQTPVDNTTAQVWFQINRNMAGVTSGQLALTLATDCAEHTVTIPAGTVLGEYTLEEDFVFYTHADGTATVAAGEEPTEPTTEPTTEPVTEPEDKTVSVTDIAVGEYRPNNGDWYLILNTDEPTFALTSVVGLQTPVDNTTVQVWFQVNRNMAGVSNGQLALTLATDCAEHTVTIPAGTVLGEYTLKTDFVFYTHADGTATVATGEEPTEPTTEPTTEPVTEPEEKTLSITDIALGVYRPNNGDWYLILNTDEPTFALTSVVGLQAPVDNTTAQVWFQVNRNMAGVTNGQLALTLATDCAEHKVTIPAGTVLGEYTLKTSFVFYTHEDGTVTVADGEEPTEPTTTEPDDKSLSITGIAVSAYRVNNGDWWLVLNTDKPAFALTSVVGLQTPVDNTTAQVWFQVNRNMAGVTSGQLALTLATDCAEHTVTIPAGTVLGEYTLEEDFVFYTHADGTVTVAEGEEPTEPTTGPSTEPDDGKIKVTGISTGVYRPNHNDWYIVLNIGSNQFALDGVVGLLAPVDETTAEVWFQSNAAMNLGKGQLAFTLKADQAEHKVTIPAGTVLGKYILEEEFIFYTHGDNTVDQEAAGKSLTITGVSLATYREKLEDWYIILDTDAEEFALSAVAGVQLPMDDTNAQVWFQSNAAMNLGKGQLAFTLKADQAEHKVTIPAGTVLGKYILEEEFIFYTHGDGTVDREAAGKSLTITSISLATYREKFEDWYIVLDTDAEEFALSAVAGVQLPLDDTTAQVWFQSNAALKVEAGKLALTLKADKAEHKVTIPAGTVLGKYILEEEFVFYVYPDGTSGNKPLPDPVDFRFVSGAWQYVPENELARYLITLEDDQTGEKTIPWAPYNCVSIDGENRSVYAFADGNKVVLILDKMAGITKPGKHTIVLRKGAYIGNYKIAQDVTFYTDGLTVTTKAPEPIAAPTETVSVQNDSRNLNSGCKTGFYFAVDPEDQLPFDDQKGSIRYSAAEGGIYVNGELTPVTVSKWLSNLYYVPLSEFGYEPKKGDVVTVDGVFGNGDHAVTFEKQSFVYDGEGNWEIGTYLRDLREQEYQIQDISELKLGLSEFEVKPGVQLIGEAASGTNIAIRAIVSTNLDATEFNLGFSKLDGMWDKAGWQVWLRPKYNQIYLAHGEVDWQVTNHYEFTKEEFVVEFGTINMDEYIDGKNVGLYCRKIYLKIDGVEVLSYMDTDLDRVIGKNLYALNSQDAVDNKLISLTSEGVTLRELEPTVYDYYDLTGFASDTIPGGQTILLGETGSSSNVAVRMKMHLDGNATELRLALSKQQGDNFWDEAGSGWQVWLRPKWDTAYIAHGTNDHEVIKPFPYAGTYTVEMGVRDVVIEKDGKRIGNYCRRVYLLINGEEIASWEDMDFGRPIGNYVMLLTSQDSEVSLSTLKKTSTLAVETIVNGKAVDGSDLVDVISQVVPGGASKISVLYRSDYNNKVTLKGLYLNGELLEPIETQEGKQVYVLENPKETDQLRVELEVKELTVDEPVWIFDLFDTSGKAMVEVKGQQYGVSLGAMVGPEGQAAVNSAVRFRLQLPNQFNQVPIGILGDVSTLWGNSGALFQITPNQVHFCHPASMTRLASFASSWFAPGSNVCVELGIVKCYENGLYRYDRWYIKAGETAETMEMVAWYDSVERGHYGGHFCCNGTDLEESYFLYSLKDIYTIEDVSAEENKAQLRTYERWGETLPELYYSSALEGYADAATAPKVGVISFFTKPGTSLSAFLVNGQDVTKDVQIGADGAYCYTIPVLDSNMTFAYEIAEDASMYTVTVETAQGLEATIDQTQVVTGDDVVLTITAQKGIVPEVTVNETQITHLLHFDANTGIWSCTLRSIRQDTTIQVDAVQRSYTVLVQEDDYCTVELGGDVVGGKLPFGGTLELTVQIADGYYVEYILVGDQKFAVDADGKLTVDRVYMDLQELVIRPVIKNSNFNKQTDSKNMTVIWSGIGAVSVFAVVVGGILLGRKSKRKADKNGAE